MSYDKSDISFDGLPLDTVILKLRTTQRVESYLRYCRDIYPEVEMPTPRIVSERLKVSAITVKRALAIAEAQVREFQGVHSGLTITVSIHVPQ